MPCGQRRVEWNIWSVRVRLVYKQGLWLHCWIYTLPLNTSMRLIAARLSGQSVSIWRFVSDSVHFGSLYGGVIKPELIQSCHAQARDTSDFNKMKKKKHDQLHRHTSAHDTPFQQIVKYMIEHVRLQGFPGCPGGMSMLCLRNKTLLKSLSIMQSTPEFKVQQMLEQATQIYPNS